MRSRSIKAAAFAAAMAFALLPAAAASARTVTYGGTTEGGGRAALDVKLRKGKVKRVLETRAVNFPFECEKSGSGRGYVTFPSDIDVERRRFRARYERDGNVSRIRGRFRRNGRTVSGSFVYSDHFEASQGFPEEDCSTERLSFRARAGDPDETLPQRPARQR